MSVWDQVLLFALGVLEGNWQPNMSEDAGVALIRQALTASRNRDAGSGFWFANLFDYKRRF